MDPRARFPAPAAAFLFLAIICCRSNFALAASGCGTNPVASGHYIVRAKVQKNLSSRLTTSSTSFVSSLIEKNPAAFIHRNYAGLSSFSTSEHGDVVTFATALSDDELAKLNSDQDVLSVENDCFIETESAGSTLQTRSPNDPAPDDSLWPRRSLNLESAWALTTDASSVIVAVSDTGVDLAHPDLQNNLWTNKAELVGLAGFDDDGNGCIDDIHGCDFADRDGNPTPGPQTEADHGTHVAGIIGAVGNNSKGIAGVAWQVQLLAAKGFADGDGSALASDLLKTIYYAANNGARVVNCSWGIARAPSAAEKDAFAYALAHGTLPVVAAGNSAVDASTTSPAAIDGVLTVGSINSQDQISSFSNFGEHVQVYAPGGDAASLGGLKDEYIYSTVPTAHGSYASMRGTSMAAPFVSGLAALIFAEQPSLSPSAVRDIILASARIVSAKQPDGATKLIKIPDAESALRLAMKYSKAIGGAAPQEAAKPIAQGGADLASSRASSSSGGCGLAKTSSAMSAERGYGFEFLLFLPIFFTLSLRKRKMP